MLISFLRWLTLAVSLIWILVYFKGGSAVIKDTKRAVADASAAPSSVISIFFISLAGLTMLLTQLLICVGIVDIPTWAQRPWFVTLGAILVTAGISAEFWIRYRFLGRFWSGNVEIQKNHQVIEKGPYRIVRHPLYAINLAIYPGTALAFMAWWSWIACGIAVAGYGVLASYEDRFLEANLPGYREYQRRTKYKFLPGVW